MGSKLTKEYPPYMGVEPFVFLCFDDADEGAVKPLLERLWVRGVRIYYTEGKSASIEEETTIQKRMEMAGVVIAFCSGSFLRSTAKARMMYLQSRNVPIISVDREEISNLAAGYREGTIHIDAKNGITDSTEMDLIAAKGFSQDYIGSRRTLAQKNHFKGVFAGLSILTFVVLVVFVLILSGVIQPKAELSPDAVTVLHLEKIPEDLTELEKYPNLQKIVIPQTEAERALEIIDKYTVVLSEGARS